MPYLPYLIDSDVLIDLTPATKSRRRFDVIIALPLEVPGYY